MKGQIGNVEIVLPAWMDGERRYRKTYIPIDPASRVVQGDQDAVAPETDVTAWKLDDWSAGEGDNRWRGKGYRYGTGAMPASDGSGITNGPNGVGVAISGQTAMARGGGRFVLAGPMNGSIRYWASSGSWSTLWSIGGSASYNAQQIAAVDPNAYFVLDTNGDIRKVQSGGNSAWYTGGNFTGIVSYSGELYGVAEFDLYRIDTDTASTRTLIGDAISTDFAGMTGRVKQMSTSDVGPIWYAPGSDGTTLIREYNWADDVATTIGKIPDDSYAYDIAFYAGIYLVSYRSAENHADTGGAYLYYQIGQQRGIAGELRDEDGTASERVAIGGVIGDRLYIAYQARMWAYDLTSGGIVLVGQITGAGDPGSVQCALTHGGKAVLGGTLYMNFWDTKANENYAQKLYSGMGDYGYIGIPKLIHTATVTTDEPIDSLGEVRLGYKVDGGAEVFLTPTMTSGARYQWDVSTSAGGSVIGTEVEWVVEVNADTTTGGPKVVSVVSDATGATSRIEWEIIVDVGQSSVNEGGDVISALNALKESYGVVQFSDPYQLRDHDTPATFDVRVKRVSTPELGDDGYLTAMVVLQTLGMVGPNA